MKAVIMCGGLGSRLRPLTETVPKPLLKIGNRAILDIIISKLVESGIDRIYLSSGYMADSISEFCSSLSYDAEIIPVEEETALGTAGGVKNALQTADEPVLVLSGDNIFDTDIIEFVDFHYNSGADISICGVYADDPRDYGIIIKNDDNRVISFLEKPTWEYCDTKLINSGMYIINPSVFYMIPENRRYDFSNDLFPVILSENMKFMCYTSDRYWGDMGSFKSFLSITKDLLDNKISCINPCGIFYKENTVTPDGGEIIAPSIVPESSVIKEGAKAGPYTVLGEGCEIGENTSISNTVTGDNCIISNNTEIDSAIIGDCVKIRENCFIDENSVLGFGCRIGKYTRILPSCRIWPGKTVESESLVSDDVYYESPLNVEFDIFGISGKINSSLCLNDALKTGQSVASVKEIRRAGIGTDSRISSEIYKDLILSGIRSCGGICYDFGKTVKSQSYFYSAYCSLDAFIYVSQSDGIISFSFYGKYGMPLNAAISKNISNNFKYSSFSYAEEENLKEKYNMQVFDFVYISFLKKICGRKKCRFDFSFDSENEMIKELAEKAFSDLCTKDSENRISFIINSDGTEMYALEKDRYFSSSRLMSLVAEVEFASGKDIIINEDAPAYLEKIAEDYGRKVTRLYEGSYKKSDFRGREIIDNLWSVDVLFLCAKLMGIIAETGQNLGELFRFQRDFSMRKNIIDFNCSYEKADEIIKNCGAQKEKDSLYYTLDTGKGLARIRKMGNAKKIKVIVEAENAEICKDLSSEVCSKLEGVYIDKDF